jgi:hypothetical protein
LPVSGVSAGRVFPFLATEFANLTMANAKIASLVWTLTVKASVVKIQADARALGRGETGALALFVYAGMLSSTRTLKIGRIMASPYLAESCRLP